MSCLEEDKCDIDQLNAEIAKLQSMQHKYSLLEFESTKSFLLSQVKVVIQGVFREGFKFQPSYVCCLQGKLVL